MTKSNLSRLEEHIYELRGLRVMLDHDLARLYGVDTRILNQAVARNADRFPEDFMFPLTDEEHGALRSQFVILKPGRGKHRKYNPMAFTEQGVAMLSSVLRSPRAIQVNIQIMRAFVRMRGLHSSSEEVTRKLEELESQVGIHDKSIRAIFKVIHQLIARPENPKRKIGFGHDEDAC